MKAKKIQVQSTTLDNALSLFQEPIDLLKIDIEGAEFDVLESSKKLDQIKMIVGEIHPDKANKNVTSIIESLRNTHEIMNELTYKKSIFRAKRIN